MSRTLHPTTMEIVDPPTPYSQPGSTRSLSTSFSVCGNKPDKPGIPKSTLTWNLEKKKRTPFPRRRCLEFYEKNSWGFSMSHGIFHLKIFRGHLSSKQPNNPTPAVFATRFSNASEASSSTSSWISATPATPGALPPWWQKPRESRWTSTACYMGNPRPSLEGGKSWQEMAIFCFHFTRHFFW